jgi:hypothetical protein
LLPLVAGVCTYIVLSPDVFFLEKLECLLDIRIHFSAISNDHVLLILFRNYFPDMMWAYALVFGIFGAYGGHTAAWAKALIVSLVFSAFLELMQLTAFVPGVFDIFDIAAEWLAEAAAVLVIQKNNREVSQHDQKKDCTTGDSVLRTVWRHGAGKRIT